MKKRIISILLAAVLFVGIAACATQETGTPPNDNANNTPDTPQDTATGDTTTPPTDGASGDRMEISLMNWGIADAFPEGMESDEMRMYIEDRFDVTFVPFNVTWGDADELTSLWASAGTLPDIIGAQAIEGSPVYFQWISDGVIRPIPSDLSAYPNVQNFVNQPDVRAFDVDGQTYMLPRQTYTDSSWWVMARGILNRKDWRESLGYSLPTTEQEFIDLCLAYVNNNPDGVANTQGLRPAGTWILPSQCFVGYGYTDAVWVKNSNGDVVIPTFESSTLPLYSFLRRLNKAGGLDEDYVTGKDIDDVDKFVSGGAGMLAKQLNPAMLDDIQRRWSAAQPGKEFTDHVEIIHPPVISGVDPVGFAEKGYWSQSFINANVDDAKMARILEVFDFFYSDEGLKLVNFGFEGRDWEMDGGQVKMLTDINPDTGAPKAAADLYPFANIGSVFCWAADMVQYDNPTISQSIRDMATTERDYRIANWRQAPIDWRITAIDVPERAFMGSIMPPADQWAPFVFDTSDRTDDDLFAEMVSNWEANGYRAAKEAMTAAARDLGY